MSDYEKGFEDGVKFAKDKALEALYKSEDMAGREYIFTRDAVRAIEPPKKKKKKSK